MRLIATLTPHDTLHLSDGRPFNQDDLGVSQADTLFPPLPSQLASCLRVCIAELLGAKSPSISRWNASTFCTAVPGLEHVSVETLIGDGPDDLGLLSFQRLWLVDGRGEIFLSSPMTIRHREDKDPSAHIDFVMPPKHNEESRFQSDLGDSDQFFSFPVETKHDDKYWLHEETFAKVLKDAKPSIERTSLVKGTNLFARESYVGLGLDANKTNIPGQLYALDHLRACEDPNARPCGYALEIEVAGKSIEALSMVDFLDTRRTIGTLGGRGRSVNVTFRSEPSNRTSWETPDFFPCSRRLYAMTPFHVTGTTIPGIRDRLTFLQCEGIELQSAAMSRASRFSTWDATSSGRTAWSWIAPAGAVFECRIADPEAWSRLSNRLLECGLNMTDPAAAALQRKLGFGAVEIGAA
ncbi:type III-B CRISPR module-associated Cmr3 family protein [Yoonia vestfoldensis]|uniref:type III-B CRISPR module-associated Cmr3 family protein n=1 Tax=Yoonia vestfoldensis TaxID=245188 RepID=UPI0003A5AD24|nr:type III-B CRISPR module-associated Cmr3 family protein [Yoonia vestfoldensis]